MSSESSIQMDTVSEEVGSDKPYIINIVNSIIGVAILAISSTFKETGILLTLLTLISGAILTQFSCSILVRAAKETQTTNYEYLVEKTLGKYGKIAIELCLIGFMMGVMIGYYIALGDLLPSLIYRSIAVSFEQRATVLIVISIFLIQPLVMLKDISSLTTASTFSLFGYSIVCSVVILYSISTGAIFVNWTAPDVIYWNTSSFFATLSLFALGFAAHPQIFIVYSSFKKPQVIRMERIISYAISCVAVLYTVLGTCGYLTFKSNTSGNVLTNYPSSSLTEAMRLSFCFSCIISFPLLIFPIRTAMYTLCKPVFDRFFVSYESLEEIVELKVKILEEDGFQKETRGLLSKKSEAKIHIPEKIFYGMSVMINLVTLTVAILVPDIAALLKIVGSTMGATLAFIIPGLIALKHKPSNDSQLKHTLTKRHRLQARILLAIGTLVFVITPISMLYE